MKINRYDSVDMSLLEEDVTGANFGDVLRAQHNAYPIVIQPELELGEDFTQLALFLENKGGLDHSYFGKYKNSEALMDIAAGSDYLSDNFVVQEGVSDFIDFEDISGGGLVLDPINPEYVWMDVQVGSTETCGSAQVNYRFVFEYF